MATFRKLPSGLWQVQVFRRGIRRSSSFASKGAAVAWAGTTEAEIMAGVRGEIPNLTVAALLERYEREITPGKKGRRWEAIRLRLMGRDRLALVKLRQLDSPHVADWQKRRLEAVASGSVRRERNLLNNVFNVAINEWKWLVKNPFKGVRRPRDGKPRQRIATPGEIQRLTAGDGALSKVVSWALETGMRASEIALPPTVYGRVAILGDDKGGDGRAVPLSLKALDIWQDEGFGLTAGSISTLFAKRCEKLKIEGLTFHDLRHTAATRLSKRLDVLELCKMFGWKDADMALNTYYKFDPEETAKKL